MSRLVDMFIGFIAAVFIAAISWHIYKPIQATVNAWTEAKTSPQVAKIEKEEVVIPKIEVYKPEAKEKLKLPERVRKDLNTAVIASTFVPADDNSVTVTTLINTQTGKSETLFRIEPDPWFAFENRNEITITQGWRDTQTMTRLSGSKTFFQTKNAHWGINGSIDLDGQKMIGASVAFRF